MSLKAQLEAIVYAAEIPITTEQMVQLVKESVIAEGAGDEVEVKSRVRSCLEELVGEYGSQDQRDRDSAVAGGTGCRPNRSSMKWCAALPRV